MVICNQGVIWHGGEEGPAAEWFKLAGSRNARDSTPCKGVRFSLEIR